MMGYTNFSMYFSSENEQDQTHHHNYDDLYNNNSLSSSTSVDCTLSLGTPSTRLDDHHTFSSAKTTSYKKGGRDHGLPRCCASCDTTSTPLWRNGPKGPKSLCNACGIRYKKEERRAIARNLTVSGGGSSATEVPVENPYNGGGNYYSHQYVPYFSPASEMEYSYMDNVTTDSFPSWN